MHLEGAVDAELLREMDPGLSKEEALAPFAFQDFPSFLAGFKFVVMRMREVEHYRMAARHLFSQLAQQGIVYAEVIHSAGVNLWRGMDARAVVEALLDEGRRSPVAVRWILDAVRQFGGGHVMEVARMAAEFSGSEVVGFGVGGNETGCPAEDLRAAFAFARQAGLHLTAHAGETSTAQNVWEALELGVERIGHGIRAIEDAALVRELAQRQVPLEISLTSNVKTGAVASLADHPARRLFLAGVPLVLNTDDPAMFDTTLARELELARRELGFSEGDLAALRENAFRFAFDAPVAAAARARHQRIQG